MQEDLKLLQDELAQIGDGEMDLGQLYVTLPEERRYPLPTEVIQRDCVICGSELAVVRYKRPMPMTYEQALLNWPNLPPESRLYCPVCGGLLRWHVTSQEFYEGYIEGIEALAVTAKPWRVPYDITWVETTCPSCAVVFEYATRLGESGIEMRCPDCNHSFGIVPGYFGAISKLAEVQEPLETRPTWTPVNCPQCGTTFEYRSFHYPYGEALICPTCGHDFGVKAGYMAKEWDMRNVVRGEVPSVEPTPVVPTPITPIPTEVPVPEVRRVLTLWQRILAFFRGNPELGQPVGQLPPTPEGIKWEYLALLGVFASPFVIAGLAKAVKVAGEQHPARVRGNRRRPRTVKIKF